MGSTRLPGKSLLPLAGVPLVGRILERVKKSKLLDEVILAIPESSENDVLANLGNLYQIKVYRGSELDLVDRYFNAALESRCKFIVRIPADNPIIYGEEIDRIISHHLKLRRPGFSSNIAEIFDSRYPDGFGAEIFDFELLKFVYSNSRSNQKSEHIHLNFFDYSTQIPVDKNWCPVSTVFCPEEFARPELVFDVNTKDQYDLIANMYKDLYPVNSNFGPQEAILWYDSLIVKKIGDFNENK
jgi:spore coat polysaccharide biosynthesis protein SpsF